MLFNITTGYGYVKDFDGNVLYKYVLPKGATKFPDNCFIVEVADQAELNTVPDVIAPEDPNTAGIIHDMIAVQQELTRTKEELAATKASLLAIQTTASGLVNDIAVAKTDLTVTKGDIAVINTKIVAIEAKLPK